MKKSLFFLLTFVLLAMGATAQLTVQGQPYHRQNASLRTDWPGDPNAPEGEDGSFTFEMIQNWAGEGANKAAVVIQWNDSRETHAIVFGYRWDGEAYSADMIKAIAAADPRFYWLTHWTQYGNTIAGFGWDRDEDGDITLYNNGVLQTATSEGTYTTTTYDYDDWTAGDADDFWAAGWYKGYWSFWTKSSVSAKFGYSQVGASSRKLEDGCWDGWNYCPDMSPRDWKTFKAAPSLTPAGAHTQFVSNGVYYTLASYTSRTVEVSAPFELNGVPADSYSGEITIPTTITCNDTTYTVTGIGAAAFKESAVTSVILPATVVKIGDEAFMNSTLSAVNITNAITNVGKYAFSGCKAYTSTTLPESLSSLPDYVFSGTGVTSYSVPANIESIGEGAFKDCASLASIVLPGTLKRLGDMAFDGCNALKSVDCESIYPLAVTDSTFAAEAYANAVVTVPMGYVGTYKAAEGWRNFVNYAEKAIPVYEGDVFVDNGVYYKVTALADDANEVSVVYCSSADNATSATEIGDANKLGYVGELTIPSSVQYQGCTMKVTAVADSAFFKASALTKVTISKDITSIGKAVFFSCSELTSVQMPDITEIPEGMFYNCVKLESVNLVENLTSIGKNAFYKCALLKLPILSESLTSMGEYAFQGCTGITGAVVLPESLTTVPASAFKDCTGITSFKFGSKVTTIGSNVLSGCTALTDVTLPDNITKIPSYMLYNTSITAIDLKEGITVIDANAFYGCKKLEKITLPSTLNTLGSYVFQNCEKLTSIVIPSNVTAIPTNCFSGCTLLTDIELQGSVKSIASRAFYNCKALKSFKIPATTTSLGTYAFSGCSNLASIDLNCKATTLPGYLLQNCTALTDVVVPSTFTTFSSNMVSGCSKSLKLWLLGKTPAKNSSNTTFQLSTGVYATVVVPFGLTETYRNASTYWTKPTIIEVEPELAGITQNATVTTDDSATLNMSLDFAYPADMAVPEAFAEINDKAFFSALGENIKVTLKYGKSPASVYVETDAAVDGLACTATLSSLEASTEYEGWWIITIGNDIHEYAFENFTTDKLTGVEATGVNNAFPDGTRWYNLQGVEIPRPTHSGIYICNGKKVVVVNER